MEAISLPDLFEKSLRKNGERVLLWEKKNDKYHTTSYNQADDRIKKYAAGLLDIGLKKGDRVALISEGRNDWLISELALLYCGAISVPLSVKIESESDLEFRLKHSGSKGIIISGNHQAKILTLLSKLPDLKFVILLDGKYYDGPSGVCNWQSVGFPQENIMDVEFIIEKGTRLLESDPHCVKKVSESINPDDYANICYTSGTTADPKGIILTHGNYIHNVKQGSSMIEIPDYFTSLHILPWDHSFAHTVGLYTLIYKGASIASVKVGKTLNETLRNIPICIKEVKPHFLLSVPALAKNFRRNIEKGIADKGKIATFLFEAGLRVAYAYNLEGFNRGQGLRFMLKPLYKLFDIILFSKIRQNFGGRLKFFVGGGALLDIELQKFFFAIGMPMYQGYGLTEASPVISTNTPDRHKMGTSGRIVPYMDLKICDDDGNELPNGKQGEIVVKGGNVMAGYWKNEATTKETIRNGWLHTGDLGYVDADGYLMVLGRTKSLLISNDGEKYSPEGIEETIVEKSTYIDQIMLYNNQNPYTTALIYVNKGTLGAWAQKNSINPASENGYRQMLKKIESDLNKFMPGGAFDKLIPHRWMPSTIYIMSEPFSEQNRMVNSTLKMVRPVIMEYYKDIIEFLYTPQARDICHSPNIKSMGDIFGHQASS